MADTRARSPWTGLVPNGRLLEPCGQNGPRPNAGRVVKWGDSPRTHPRTALCRTTHAHINPQSPPTHARTPLYPPKKAFRRSCLARPRPPCACPQHFVEARSSPQRTLAPNPAGNGPRAKGTGTPAGVRDTNPHYPAHPPSYPWQERESVLAPSVIADACWRPSSLESRRRHFAPHTLSYSSAPYTALLASCTPASSLQ